MTMIKRFGARSAIVAGVLSLAAALILAACYPGDVTSVAELDLVVTQFDSTHVWIAPATFAVWDSVVHLKDTVDAGNNIPLGRQYDSLILATIKSNMLACGYTELANPDSANLPDYYVVASAIAVKNYTVNAWYPYYPGWCCYYPWYPPYWTVSSYEVGTLFVDMYNTGAISGDVLPDPWRAILNGPLTSTSVSSRLTNGI